MVVDAFHKVGLNVDEQMTDWGTVVQRRPSKEKLDKGGWSMFPAGAPGPEYVDPLLANTLRSNGAKAWFGWPDDPVLEAAYEGWIDAPNETERQKQAVGVPGGGVRVAAEYSAGAVSAACGVAVERDGVGERIGAGVLGGAKGMNCAVTRPSAITCDWRGN